MGLSGIKREGTQGFQKVVYENVQMLILQCRDGNI